MTKTIHGMILPLQKAVMASTSRTLLSLSNKSMRMIIICVVRIFKAFAHRSLASVRVSVHM